MFANAEKLLTKSPYEGQVNLCPPQNFPIYNCTVSTGLVLINMYGQWRGLNQNSSYPRLGSHEANSICRQLGYTHAVVNSAIAMNSTGETYSHCYYNGYDDNIIL